MAYVFANGYTRRYYKTINVSAEYAIENYPRPFLAQNGTLGGNSFAVYASSQYDTSDDYAPYASFRVFGGDYGAISEDGVTISESNPWEYIMYFPEAICITEINMLNRASYPHAPQKGYIEGSNNNTSYTTLCSFTNSNNESKGTWKISIPSSNQRFYKYYKFKFTSAPTANGIYVALGFPTWKHKAVKSPAYSYEIQSTENDYDRYEDVLNTLSYTNGYTRKYYKTINTPEEAKPFKQPILWENGTLGESIFAVSASSENQSGTNPYRAFEAFDGNSDTYWRCTNTTSGWIQFYNPKPIRVASIKWGYYYSYPTGGSVLGSNDGTNFDTLTTWTNSSAADFTITVNSTKAYKYYRITVTGVNKDVIHCKEITITATVPIKKASSYEIESTIDDYDRYEDILNIFEVKL